MEKVDIMSLFNQGLYDKVIEEFNKRISQPFNIQEIIAIGISYYFVKDYRMALKLFQEVLEIEPMNQNALFDIIVVLYELGDINSAYIYAQRLLKVNPKEPIAYLVNGLYEVQRGNFQSAIELFKVAQENSEEKEHKEHYERLIQYSKHILIQSQPMVESFLLRKKYVVHIAIDSIYTKEFLEKILTKIKEFKHYIIVTIIWERFVKEGIIDDNIEVLYAKKVNVCEFQYLTNLLLYADKIFLHGNFSLEVFELLVSLNVLYKTYWFIWGGDLYDYFLIENPSQEEVLFETMKRLYNKKFRKIMGSKPDYEFAVQKYGQLGEFVRIAYPVLDNFDVNFATNLRENSVNTNNKTNFNVLLGNSANKTMNHIPTIDFLSTISKTGVQFKVYCPLSYGVPEYGDQVEKAGKEKLGKNFVSLRKFIDKQNYSRLLASMDVGIFNSYRSQAMGNIIKLLLYGKKVVVPAESQIAKVLRDYGFSFVNFEEIVSNPKKLFEPLRKELIEQNQSKVFQLFSTDNLIQMWKKLISE